MQCPRCGNDNDISSERCRCGYDLWSPLPTKDPPARKDWFDGPSLIALGWASIAIGVVASVMGSRGYPAFATGAVLIARGQRKRNIIGDEQLQRDGRKPILYLRAFESDASVSETTIRTSVMLISYLPRTALERLAAQLRKIGPFICIGKPGEKLPHAGPAAIYVDDRDWEHVVQARMKNAAFLVFHAELNWNTERELQWAERLVGPTRLLFWFARVDDLDYNRFAKQAPSYLPCQTLPDASNVRFVYFDRNWTAHVVRAPLLDRVFGFQSHLWTSLAPFLEQVGVDEETRTKYVRRLEIVRFGVMLAVIALGLSLIW
jgi:hypothetical protein